MPEILISVLMSEGLETRPGEPECRPRVKATDRPTDLKSSTHAPDSTDVPEVIGDRCLDPLVHLWKGFTKERVNRHNVLPEVGEDGLCVK